MDVEVDGILVAAHELKQPLVDLRQLALMLDGADAENGQIRDEMVSVSERAIRQINDLMKLRRLDDGLFNMEPVAVRAMCDEVTQELRQMCDFDGRDLIIKYANRTPLVVANRELLKSVVYNFLVNALKYVNEGAKTTLTVQDKRDKVQILVRDFGPALPMNIWREMRRGWLEKPTSIAMRPGSSGLGLFIASRFSRYMNAEVGAIRHRDGTSFYVRLLKSKQGSLFE